MAQRRKFSPEFKQKAVDLVVQGGLKGGMTIPAAAKKMGIGESSLGKWVSAYRNKVKVSQPKPVRQDTPHIDRPDYQALLKTHRALEDDVEVYKAFIAILLKELDQYK